MRSIRAYLLLMAVTTTTLTTVLVLVMLAIIFRPQRGLYNDLVLGVVLSWQQQEFPIYTYEGIDPQGYIVGSDNRVIYTYGATSCQVGDIVTQCVEDLEAIPAEGRTITRDGITWYEFRRPLRDGMTVVLRVQPDTLGRVALSWAEVAPIGGLVVIGAVPVALVLSLMMMRPLARRLHHIAEASHAFAAGDLSARTGEYAPDEIGQLGHQFDQMATTISTQMQELRRLVEENTDLTLTAERNARAAERATLSRDLHDSVSQHLFSLAMGTADLASFIRRNPEQAAQQAEQLATIAAHAQDELRSVLAQLRPGTATDRNLVSSLNDFVQVWRARYAISADVQARIGDAPLPLLVEDVLYRVCQEGLNNVARHAAAGHVLIKIDQVPDAVWLSVTDDGCGFDPDAQTFGLGLIGMRERVRAVGGVLEIVSRHGAGTRLQIRIPLIQTNEVDHANQSVTG